MQHRLVFVIGTESFCTIRSTFFNIAYIQCSVHGVNLTISWVSAINLVLCPESRSLKSSLESDSLIFSKPFRHILGAECISGH